MGLRLPFRKDWGGGAIAIPPHHFLCQCYNWRVLILREATKFVGMVIPAGMILLQAEIFIVALMHAYIVTFQCGCKFLL